VYAFPALIGETLRHYEITAKLGEGGMGEVYRASDTRLNREVAIKVLPAALTEDEERLARFEREAQVLASLNHPNIAAIYGLERAGSQWFLVLELVEGVDLAERLAEGPLPASTAFALAEQMAVGISAAHEAGIVHRDLKPANIRITPGEQVKILDFGLAKAQAASAGDSNLTQSPTLTAQMTQAGVILGTAGYMSPEQARGQEADARSDVWSFAVILFEMLTGTRAFQGNTVSDVLASVLKETPDLALLPPEVTEAQRWVLAHCLEHDPANRLADLRDVRLLLTGLPQPTETEGEVVSRRSGITAIALACGALLGLIAAYLLTGGSSGLTVSAPLRQYSIVTPEIRFGGWSSSVAISSNGDTVAFETYDGIQIRNLSEPEPRNLALSTQTREPFFSPNGAWLAYKNDEQRSLEKIFLDGGSPMHLFGGLTIANQGTWSEDGTIYYGGLAEGQRGLQSVSEAGGDRQLVHEVSEYEVTVSFADALPGGRFLLVTVYRERLEGGGTGSIELLDLETGEMQTVFDGATQARYSSTGHLVVVTGEGILSAIPFDIERLKVTGPPRRLVSGVRTSHGNFNANFAISQTGTLIYAQGEGASGLYEIAFLDSDCKLEAIVPEQRWYANARLSPDGRYVLVGVKSLKGEDIWQLDIERNTSTRLFVSEDGGLTRDAVWYPDSRSYTYVEMQPSGGPELKKSSIAGGSSILRPDPGGRDGTRPTDVIPGGEAVMLQRRDREGDWGLFRLDNGQLEEVVGGGGHQGGGRVSPDGRWVSFLSNRSGQMDVYIQPLGGTDPRAIPVSTGGGRNAFWGPEGKRLFFQVQETLRVVDINATEDRLEISTPRPFCPEVRVAESFDATTDGERLLVRVGETEAQPVNRIQVIENWPALLEGGSP